MSTTETNKFIAKLCGLYVTDVWPNINKVNLGSKRSDADEELDAHDIKWLKENVEGIKFIKIIVTVEEIEQTVDEIILK